MYCSKCHAEHPDSMTKHRDFDEVRGGKCGETAAWHTYQFGIAGDSADLFDAADPKFKELLRSATGRDPDTVLRAWALFKRLRTQRVAARRDGESAEQYWERIFAFVTGGSGLQHSMLVDTDF